MGCFRHKVFCSIWIQPVFCVLILSLKNCNIVNVFFALQPTLPKKWQQLWKHYFISYFPSFVVTFNPGCQFSRRRTTIWYVKGSSRTLPFTNFFSTLLLPTLNHPLGTIKRWMDAEVILIEVLTCCRIVFPEMLMFCERRILCIIWPLSFP